MKENIDKIIRFLADSVSEMESYMGDDSYSDLEKHDCRIAQEAYQRALDYAVDLAYAGVEIKEYTIHVVETDLDITFQFAEPQDKKKVYETIDGLYCRWMHPEREEEEELAEEIESSTPEDWIEDHVCEEFDVICTISPGLYCLLIRRQNLHTK